MKRKPTINQQGIVSLLITMIMMIVITLIVLGFTQVVRRNQREALDSQLGTQAYYAAESGVNAAQTFIKTHLTAGVTLPNTTANGCATYTDATASLAVPTNIGTGVAFTCVTINPTPGSLVVNNVGQATASVLHAQSSSGNFGTLTFKWTPNVSGGGCPSAGGTYPIATNWSCGYGILRVDILKASGLANWQAVTLANATSSLYLQPSTSNSGNLTVSFGGTTKAFRGTCLPANGSCSVTIDVSTAAASDFWLRLSTIYQDAPTVEVFANGGALTFQNGQVVIDSTGRAQDQVKRIQVRLPVTQASTQVPAYGLMSTGEICKDLSLSSVTSFYDAGQCGTDEPGWPNVGSTF
jgi:Tfp pilus assembly protein PilX